MFPLPQRQHPTPEFINVDIQPGGPSIESFLEEGSGPNKRTHVEEVPDSPIIASVPNPEVSSSRNKKKVSKKVGKKIDSQPLVGMFDESIGTYDKPVSVCQMLKNHQVDLSWMELLALSPEVCREMKRLSTRVSKKRTPKAKPGQAQNVSHPSVHFPPSGQPGMPYFPGMMPSISTGLPASFQVPPYIYPTHQPGPQGSTMPFQPTQSTTQTFQPSQATTNPAEVLSASTDSHTKFLHSLHSVEKAFQIGCTVKASDGREISLGKAITQVDQGSEMNVISATLLDQLRIPKFLLADIGFQGLNMETADHRQSPLKYWTEF